MPVPGQGTHHATTDFYAELDNAQAGTPAPCRASAITGLPQFSIRILGTQLPAENLAAGLASRPAFILDTHPIRGQNLRGTLSSSGADIDTPLHGHDHARLQLTPFAGPPGNRPHRVTAMNPASDRARCM